MSRERSASLAAICVVGLFGLAACTAVPQGPASSPVPPPNTPAGSAGSTSSAGAAAGSASTAVTAKPDEPLINTYWKLITLRGMPVVVGKEREPHLILQSGGNRIIGHGGCNRFFGTYAASADRLTVRGLASTRMACPDGGTSEQDFLQAIEQAATWRVSGATMELRDAAGVVLARFEVRHL